MPVAVPAYVVEEARQENGVIVVGGTNWDLSRTAVETPISKEKQVTSNSNSGAPEGTQYGKKPCYCQPTDFAYEGAAYQVKDLLPKHAPDLTIVFPKNSAVLSKDARKQLDQLSSNKGVILAGNSGILESSPSALASARVAGINKYLAKKHIKVFFTDSFGASRPVSTSDALDFKNARVDVWVQRQATAEDQ